MKTKLLFFAIISLSLFSCSNDDSVVIEEPTPSAVVLVKKTVAMNMSGELVTSIWNYEDSKLLSIISDNGNEQYFTYTGDLITGIESHNEFNETTWDEFQYDSEGRVVLHKELSEAFGRKELYSYDDSDSTVAVVKYFGTHLVQDELIMNGIMYFENGEITHTKMVYIGGDTTISDYTYDTKNSPYKNITGYNDISALFNFYLKGISRNVIENIQTGSDMQQNAIVKKYSYTADDYPSKISSMDPLDGDTGFVEYFYE